MNNLIEKLEAATEGSRELDYAIAEKTGWQFHGEEEFKEYGLNWKNPADGEWEQLTWWTTSLDAALTLVPDGWGWTIESDGIAAVRSPESEGDDELAVWGLTANGTPALAVCIAALKVLGGTERE